MTDHESGQAPKVSPVAGAGIRLPKHYSAARSYLPALIAPASLAISFDRARKFGNKLKTGSRRKAGAIQLKIGV
jgi:hypothetical protein